MYKTRKPSPIPLTDTESSSKYFNVIKYYDSPLFFFLLFFIPLDTSRQNSKYYTT